jgi:serine/threonine-protein kinase
MDSSRNLDDNLFAALAVLMGFVEQSDVLAAMQLCADGNSSKLGEILVVQNKLSQSQYETLVEMVRRRQAEQNVDSEGALPTIDHISPDHHDPRNVPGLNSDVIPVSSPDNVASRPTNGSDDNVRVTAIGERFTKLESHAKGGIGEVFRAHDDQLGRIVALKELQSRYADDPAKVSRFFIEAEITASLEHPGIVPVHAIGRDDTTLPFYAMRFIQGESLRDAIHKFHDKANGRLDFSRHSLELQNLLTRFIAVCNAIQYAHSRGVIHRDIKPANIMLGDYGETLVVDWGMARVIGHQEEISVSQQEETIYPKSPHEKTSFGSAMGTPAFMSPEQARGKIDELGRRSDVYSLGATLYYLLTRKPPVIADSTSESLRKVAQGDFPRPKEVNSFVPAPLEAICLKAMKRERSERYSSARAMASDLQRWIADEPVSAHHDGAWDRITRWGRHHRGWVRAAMIAGCIVVVVVTLALGFVERSRRREIASRAEAVRRFYDSVNTVDKWLTGFTDALEFYPGTHNFRKQMLEEAAKDYESFTKDEMSEASLELERGRTLVRLGDIRRQLEQHDTAILAYEKAEEVFSKLAASTAVEPAPSLIDLAQSRLRKGVVTEARGEFRKARELYQSAVSDLTPLAERHTKDERLQDALVSALTTLGGFLVRTKQLAEAQRPLNEALNRQISRVNRTQLEPKARSLLLARLAEVQLALGHLHFERDDYTQAKAEFTNAVGNWDQIINEEGDVPRHLAAKSAARVYLGNATNPLGYYNEAEQEYRQAIDVYKNTVENSSNVPAYRHGLALAQCDLGQLLCELGRPNGAIDEHSKGHAALLDLVSLFPENVQYKKDLAVCLDNLGKILVELGRYDEALYAHEVAGDYFRQVVASPVGLLSYLDRYATCQSHLGHVHHRLKEYDKAVAAFQDAINALEQCLKNRPEGSSAQTTLAIVWELYGHALFQQGHIDSARQAYESAKELWGRVLKRAQVPDYFYRAANFHIMCPVESVRDAQVAVDFASKAVNAAPNHFQYQGTLAAAHFRAGSYQESAELCEKLLPESQGDLGRVLFFLCMAEQKLGKPEQARQHFDRAVEWAQQNRPGNYELLQLQIEAAALLGLDEPKDS